MSTLCKAEMPCYVPIESYIAIGYNAVHVTSVQLAELVRVTEAHADVGSPAAYDFLYLCLWGV